MRRLLIINNIPTPYRTFMFNKLREKGVEHGVEVRVAFQAERMDGRPWRPEEQEMRFPHFTSTGLNPLRKEPLARFTYGTVNPDILLEVASRRYDWVLLAPLLSLGSWATALAPSGRTRKLLWSEGNMTRARYLRGPAKWFKGMLETPFSALVCPGQRAVDYVCYLNPKLKHRPVIWLPNIVDTSFFISLVDEFRSRRDDVRRDLGLGRGETMLLAVGRMLELKGHKQLIDALARVSEDYRLVVLGDGPQRQELLAQVESVGLRDKVHLPGEMKPPDVARYLAAADWFVHPSLEDSSPLVVIEALVAGLPLAVSTQTGNAPEVVEEGGNGFTFDPTSTRSFDETLKRVLTTEPHRLQQMGDRSKELSRERFDPDVVADSFFRSLLLLQGG